MRFLAVAGAICLLAVTAHADRPAPVADDVISGVTMPRNLSDYNFFQDVGGRKPNKGVTLYRLNSPLFTDYADKYRYIYVPSGKTVSARLRSGSWQLNLQELFLLVKPRWIE